MEETSIWEVEICLKKVDKKFHILGVTPVALRAPSVTPSITLNNYFINFDTVISIEL